ncbi:MAG: hypothetical protein M0Q00_05335 [Acholeplasmataceae bacterium]|nr:hypothetical protein [Acholeplasmataceae bacterium]
MKTYDIFHGYTLISEIGKELRKIIINEKSSFKILTGYGSKTGFSKSKQAALRSLAKIKKEGLIKGYFPGEVKDQLLSESSPYYDSKIQFEASVRKDKDYGNDGIIFIFK